MSDEFDALSYLQAVYRGRIIAESQRMKAAIAALPFARAKLAVIANVNTFGSRMERMMEARGLSPVKFHFQNWSEGDAIWLRKGLVGNTGLRRTSGRPESVGMRADLQ